MLPFSDESLVRLAANCQTPIVSAIGHEKDAPLLDLVADWRASTPTDAGKRVVPDMEEELTKIKHLQERAVRYLRGRIDLELSRIDGLRARPVLANPVSMVSSRAEVITGLRARAHRTTSHRIELGYEEVANLATAVRTLSPQSTLERGYSVVQKSDGAIVRDATQLTHGEKLRLRFAAGEGSATAD